jgi:hypothetical protein
MAAFCTGVFHGQSLPLHRIQRPDELGEIIFNKNPPPPFFVGRVFFVDRAVRATSRRPWLIVRSVRRDIESRRKGIRPHRRPTTASHTRVAGCGFGRQRFVITTPLRPSHYFPISAFGTCSSLL